MTYRKGLKVSLAGIFAAALITACGTDGTVLNSALDGNNLQNLAYRTEGSDGQFGKGQMGHGMKEGFQKRPGGQFGQADIFAGLDLSDEQKSELEALRDSLRPDEAERPDQTQREEDKALIEAAFVSDSFDADALEATLAESKPDKSDHLKQQAEFMIASWNILTDEQKATVKTNQAEREAKFTEMADKMSSVERPDRPEFDGTSRLAEVLSLSDEQSAALTALHENKPERPDPQTMHAQAQATQTAIQAELDKASPSADAIVAILEANRPDDKASPLARLADLHDILTADQRQAFVDAGLAGGNQGPEGGPGRQGGPQMGSKMGRNGQGGPGGHPMGGHPGFAGGGIPQN